MTSTITADSSASQIVGYFDTSHILTGFVDATIDAIRVGVPAKRMPNQALFAGGSTQIVVESDRQQLQFWMDRRDDAEARLARARKLSMDPAIDDDEAAEYQTEARKHRRAARDARDRIAELEAPRTEQDVPVGPFNVRTDIWLKALANLRKCGGRLSQAEYRAFKVIVPTLSFELVSGVWWGRAIIRVNTDEGVAELGPVSWRIGRGGQGVSTLAAGSVDHASDKLSRKLHRHALTSSGRLTEGAVVSVMNAPFPQLVALLLHAVCGQPWPTWVDAAWRHPTFVAWITKIYTDPNFTWLGNGKWGQSSPVRQLLADTASRPGGATVADVSELVRASMNIATRAVIDVECAGKIRPWISPVAWSDSSLPIRERGLVPVQCRCGDSSLVVTRIPEVVSDVLCACGRMVDAAKYGAPDDLLFPEDYQRLRMPAEQALEACRERFGGIAAIPPKTRTVLMRLSEFVAGATALELSAALSEPGRKLRVMTADFERLSALGFIVSDRARPARWTLTTTGAAAVANLSEVADAG